MAEIKGIHQSDVIIRTALITGLQRLRDNSDLLDDVFASLRDDDLTKGEYGDSQIDKAKRWFLNSDVPVFMSFRADEAKCPCISIGLQESTEAEQTHGDVHYVTEEETEATWPAIAGPFNPVAYAPSSGIMVMPQEIATTLILGAGMWIVDAEGNQFQIIEVLDDDTVGIVPGSLGDFRGAVLKGAKPRFISTIESVNFRETYVIGCHVMGNPAFLAYLHSIALYCLLKYKQELLEARGLERTTLSSTEFRRNDVTEQELMYSRAIILNGFVRQSWRKDVTERVDAVDTTLVMGTDDSQGPPVFDNGQIDTTAASDVFSIADGAGPGWSVDQDA